MFKNNKNSSKDIKGLDTLNETFNSRKKEYLPHKRWIWQLIISILLLFFIVGAVNLELKCSNIINNYLGYYLHGENSDWTPAIKAMVNSGLWVDSYDRQVFEDFNQTKDLKETKIQCMTLPVSGKYLRKFGWVNSPVDKNKRFNSGIEIETSKDTFIRAASGGEIVRIWNDEKIGRAIEIKHNEKLSSIYGYCNEVLVDEKQIIAEGQIIGKVGIRQNKGIFYFEVRENGKCVDPMIYLDSSKTSI
jgi:murein DD-endopeptidase MepM/ murein hydrolase activator NlpD